MHILTSAQSFGFGPAAKLVGIAAALESPDIGFAGTGIALRYAQLNCTHFSKVTEFDFTDSAEARRLVAEYDVGISVMEPRLVYACVREGKPVHFFDSLFAFWSLKRPLAELMGIADTVRRGRDDEAEAAVRSLSVHESMLLCHLISTGSYVQSGPGQAERISELAELGVNSILVTGSMIDWSEIDGAMAAAQPRSRTLVVNLGGFANAFLNYGQHGAYVDIIVRWVETVARRRAADFDRIVVCSGAFAETREQNINGVSVTTGLLPHAELLALVAGGATYLAPPGLTSLHEAVALRVPLMLLPDQHFGHAYNRRMFDATVLGKYATSFDDLGLDDNRPDDDLSGTLAIARIAAAIDRDPELFGRFAAYLDERLDAFLDMTADEREACIEQLQGLLAGTPIGDVMSDLQRGMLNGTAGFRLSV